VSAGQFGVLWRLPRFPLVCAAPPSLFTSRPSACMSHPPPAHEGQRKETPLGRESAARQHLADGTDFWAVARAVLGKNDE
jgi:hypothetical protein